MLNWIKCYDDDSNTEWYCSSYLSDESNDYYWRLSQKLECDQVIWYENHDEDISDEYSCDFKTIEEAKHFIEIRNKELMEASSIQG
jgi:hypothetical protein